MEATTLSIVVLTKCNISRSHTQTLITHRQKEIKRECKLGKILLKNSEEDEVAGKHTKDTK